MEGPRNPMFQPVQRIDDRKPWERRVDNDRRSSESQQEKNQEPGFLDRLASWLGSNMESNPMYNDPDLMGLADRVLAPNQNLAADNNTYVGSLSNAAVGGAAGVVGGIADLLGAETLGNRMAAVMENTRDENEVPAGFNWDYITSPHGLARSTGNMLGSMAAIAPASMLMPESAALGIAARLGGNRGVQFLIDRGYTNLANRFAATLPKAIQWQATAIPEAMAEGGGVVRDARQRGLSDPYGRGWMTAAENLPGLLGSNLLEGLTLGGVFKARPGAGMFRRAATVPMSAGAEGVQNAGEEAYQQFIQNLNTDRPLGEGVADAAAEGFFGSLLLGGLGGAAHAAMPEGESYTVADEVSDPTVTDLTDQKMRLLDRDYYNKYGRHLYVTSMSRNGNGDSWHDSGQAFDTADDILESDAEARAWLINQGAKYGLYALDEYEHPSEHATGGHIHFSDHGEEVSGMPSGSQGETSTGYDPNFTDKENEAWQEAQWVESQTGIPAEYIYRQWAHESANFTSRLARENNNFGGLTQEEPNGEDNKQPDGGNYYREYKDMHEYAQSYVNDFINRYDGKENVKSMEDFVSFLHNHGYFTGDPGDYLASMQGVSVPSTRGGYSKTSSNTSQTQQSIDTYDGEMNAMYEGFAKHWRDTATNANDVDFFHGMFENDGDGPFINTEENIQKIRERVENDLAEPFRQYVDSQKANNAESQKQVPSPSKAPQETPKIEAKTNRIDALKESLGKHREAAIQRGDMRTYNAIEGVLRSGDVSRMQQVLSSLPALPEEASQQAQAKSAQNTPQATQAQPQSAQTQGQYNTKRYWSGDSSPVDHNGKSLYLASPLHSSNLGDSYTPEQIARLGEEAKRFGGSVVGYRGNTAIGFENADDRKQFVDAMNHQTNNGRQEHPVFGQSSQNQMDAAKIKNAYNAGMAPMEGTAEGRKRQGRGLLVTAKAAGMKIDKQLENQLRNGQKNAIQQVQGMIRSAGLQPTLNGLMPVSTDELAKATGGMNNESTESATPAPTQGTGNAQNQNQNAESGQAEEAGKIESKPVKVFREKAEKVVGKYRNDKITYQKAYDALYKDLEKAYYAAQSREVQEALMDEFGKYVNVLESILQEKEGNVSSEATQEEPVQNTQNVASETTQEQESDESPQQGQQEETSKQKEKPADAENNTAKSNNKADDLRKEAQQFKDLVDKAIASYDSSEIKDLFKKKAAAIEKISGYFDDLSPELKDHKQIRSIYENARIHFGYNEGEHMLSAKKGVLADKFREDVEKLSISEDHADETMAAVNDDIKSKNFMGRCLANIKRTLEEKLSNKTYKEGMMADIDKWVEYLFISQPTHQFFDGDEGVGGKYSPAAVARILIDRLKSGITDVDELFAGSRETKAKQERKEKELQQKSPDEIKGKQKESIFGDEDAAISEMYDALGITEDEAEEEISFGNEFGDTTDEEIEALKKELQKELSKLSANPVFNPRIYTLGLQLGGKYIQKGYRTFRKWLNKMVGDIGENIEPWAPAIWETLKTYPKGEKFDTKQVMAVSKVIGTQFEKGITTLEGNQDVMKKLLKGKYKSFAPMIEASYNGIKKFFDDMEGGARNGNHDSTGGLASRTGEGNHQDAVGRDDEGGRPGRGSDGEGVSSSEDGVQRQGSVRVRGGGAASGRETGNRGVQAEESKDRADRAGSAELSGSVRDSYDGSMALDDGRQAEDLVSPEERRVNEGNRQVKKDIPYKAGNLDSIKADLPMLLPEQQEDVQFIENRLLVNDGAGVLLTNGTGTGKTYSGLGVVKRFADSGKENILIVVPSEEVAKQWGEAAKKDFGLDVTPLESVKDSGNGICVTTYANFQQNKELVKRDWDAVVADESHNLMQNKDGEETGYLSMLRMLTLHPRKLYERFKAQNRSRKIQTLEEEMDELSRQQAEAKKDGNRKDEANRLQDKIVDIRTQISQEYRKLNDKWETVKKELEAMDPKDRPKVLFLSATPFAYDKCVDYAEGYLFDYPAKSDGGYNSAGGRDKFMVDNFGYRMRYNKLTRPESQVDNRVMEIQFHDSLVNSGAMRGRQIDIDADYDRGFILVDGGIGTKIDEGFRWLSGQKKYKELAEVLRKQFDAKTKKYLLESIKAKAVIPLVNEYLRKGKKVVLFHQVMKEKANVHPFALRRFSAGTQEESERIRQQWDSFVQERPDLVKLNLNDVPSPGETFRKAFWDKALYIDGEHKKDRKNAQKLFNDDNSGKDIIICQQDAANAGISLHDTTGKHPRVLINIAMPERPIYATQIEGRIYRVGNKSNAVFRYLATGTDMERDIFANNIGSHAETAENLAQGRNARGLHDSFTNLYMETMDGSWERRRPGHPEEGTGGKEMDFSGREDVSDWQRAISFYFGQQKKTSRTKAAEGSDYFATPEPIGLKMVQWLGLKDGDSVLEPSAGHGAISRWFSPNTQNTIVEPSGKLSPLAQMVTPEAKVVSGRFEDFNVVNKFDGIAMNPPFGQGGKTAVEHIAKAFRHLRDGGRLIAILPEGSSADAHFNRWFWGVNKEGNSVYDPKKETPAGIDGGVIVGNIHLPQVVFKRAGTSVGTRIVVIDKQKDKHLRELAEQSAGIDIDLRNVTDINDLFERMENMAVPEKLTSKDLREYNKPKTNSTATKESGNFESGTFTHTKTGEKIPQAKLREKVSDDAYKAINSLAKQHGGYYSRFGKAFFFKDEAKRDEFVEAADALLGMGDAKFSVQAWHGSPHDFERFSLQSIGTGEGAQVHGWGLYFAKERGVSEAYRETLRVNKNRILVDGKKWQEEKPDYTSAVWWAASSLKSARYNAEKAIRVLRDAVRKAPNGISAEEMRAMSEAADMLDSGTVTAVENNGSLLQVKIPDEDVMLDEQKPFVEQPYKVHEGLKRLLGKLSLEQKAKISNDKALSMYLSRYNDTKTVLKAIEEASRNKENASRIFEDFQEAGYFSNEDVEKMLSDPNYIRLQIENHEARAKELKREIDKKAKGISFYDAFKDKTGREIYETLSNILGGDKNTSEKLNECGVKGITYVGGRDGRCYVVFDDNAIDIIAKFSKGKGKIEKMLKSITFPEDSELTTQQQEISKLGEELGTKVVWFNGNPNLHGFHQNNITFLNRNSKMDVQKVFYHEVFHWIRNNNDEMYGKLIDAIQKAGVFTQEQLDGYRERTGRYDLSDSETIEEMLADEFESPAKRHDVLNRIAKQDKGLVERFVAWMKKMVDRIAETFHNPQGRLTTAQRNAFVEAFGKMAASIRDQHGNPVFKTYNGYRTIRLANGQELADVKFSAETNEGSVDTGKKVGDNKHKVTRQFDDIPEHTARYVGEILNDQAFARRIRPSEDVDSLCDRMEAEIKKDVENQIHLYLRSANPIQKQVHLNLGALYVGMVDELRRGFNEGGQVYRSCIESPAVQGQATEGSNLARSIQSRNRQIEEGKRTRSIAVKSAAATDGFTPEVQQVVDDIRQQDRGDGIKFSANLNTNESKHSESQGASSMPKFSADSARKYSVNPSDNSSESLDHRIKNLLSGQKPEEYRHRKMMADLLGKALKITIRGGKISDSKGNVIYKESDRVIRSRHMYDWENILPVAGSVIAERLGIVKKASQTPEEMRNYIASWILTGNPNNTSSEAKEFQEAMQRNPFLADSLMKVREAFEEWNSMDAKEQMRETIQMTKAQKTNWKEVMEHTYDQLVEELGPVERLVQEIQGEMKKAGHTLSHAVNPMVAFRLARGSHGRAITMIEGRGEAAVNALKKNFPNVDFTGFKTLHDILKDIKAFQNIEKQRDFITYCTACHVMDMHRKNTDIRLEQQHLRNKAAKAQDKKERKDLEKQAEALEKEIMPIPDAFTEENCEKYIREGEEEYAQAQKDLVQFSNTSAAILADSGVISQKRYRELLSSWPNYVPMFRVFEDNEDIDFGDSLRHIKGSLRDIVNPLESIIRNTTEFVRKAEYNKARCLLANLARCDGSGMLLEEVDNSKPNDKTTITFYEDGVRKYLQTDPSVVQAVNNMNRGNSNAVLHVLHAITSVARACFTIASPEFATRNIFRDYADMAVYNKNGFVSPADMIRAFLHAVRRDETYYEWLSSGAAIASAVSLDRNYTQETIDKLGRSWRKRLASKQFLPALLEGLQKASEYSEYATRIAMYEKTKQHLTKGETKAAAYEAMVGAAFESRDLMDFARHGKAGEFWNKLVPFANASLQGMNKFYRTCLDPKGWRERPKEMAWALARLILSSAIPAMLLCLLHRDEDWYKEAPDWLKETHWLIPVGDTILRIPKGSDVGIRYISNLVEKGMSGKSYSMKEYNMPLWDALPDLLPIATKPIIEAYLNKSFFTGRNIVPQWQEKLPEKLQYGPYTTGMAKVVGELLGIAPSKIDHVLSGYVGSVGMALWKGLDILAGDRQLDTALEEMPLTRALTYMPYKNPQSVQDFYKKLDEQTKLENEFKLTGKRPDGLDPALLNRLKVVKKQLAPLSKREREIVDNKGYSLEQRKRMQMEIQQRRIRIVEGALGK